MQRIQKVAAAAERLADHALNKIRKLQRDRFAALDVHWEIYLFEQKADMPASCPSFKCANPSPKRP